ncbi:MAG: hypothetical protein CMN30_01295 [Sandaracinus sp.]|nr:hypothetical protein [Sandaracinus sp.]
MATRAPRPPRPELLLIALASLLGAAPAAAHLGHDVLRAERYLKIEVGDRGARFVVSLTLGPAEMGRILAKADADEDGEVSQAEADAYMADWGAGLATELPVTLDGDPVALQWGEAFFDPVGPVRPANGNVEMVAFLELDGGEHELRLADGMRLEVLERTDVRLATEGDVELLAAGPADTLGEGEPTTDFAFGNDSRQAPDAVGVRVRVPGMAAWQKLALAGGAVLAALIALLAWWRLRRAA